MNLDLGSSKSGQRTKSRVCFVCKKAVDKSSFVQFKCSHLLHVECFNRVHALLDSSQCAICSEPLTCNESLYAQLQDFNTEKHGGSALIKKLPLQWLYSFRLGADADTSNSILRSTVWNPKQGLLSLLKNDGLCITDLRAEGATPSDFIQQGITCMQLHDAGVSLAELRACGFSFNDLCDMQLSFHVLKHKQVFPVASLVRDFGATTQDLLKLKPTKKQLLACAFTVIELQEIGFTIEIIKSMRGNNRILEQIFEDFSDADIRRLRT